MRLGMAVLIICASAGALAQKPVETPFRLLDGWAILAEGTLGGITGQKMLIDTGAVPSAINRRVAKRLGLTGPSAEMSVMNGAVNVQRVQVPEVRLGTAAATALDMVALDLSKIEQALHTNVDAVIGLDLLAHQNFCIDYKRRMLRFGGSPEFREQVPIEVRHEAGGTYLIASIESAGERFQVIVDTGTKDLMLFRQRLRGKLRELHTTSETYNVNAGGRDRIAQVAIPTLRFGAIAWTGQTAYLWTGTEDQMRDFDGLLGPRAVGIKVLAFDFDRRLVSFETH
jgi:predicted aspartyl protease